MCCEQALTLLVVASLYKMLLLNVPFIANFRCLHTDSHKVTHMESLSMVNFQFN